MIRRALAAMLGQLPRLAVAGLVVALLAGLFVPVYSDEVGWRLQERAAIDGVDKLYSDQCGANTLAPAPWFMLPVRAYSALFNTAFADPFWIRVSGVLYALAWCFLLLRLVARLAPSPDARRDLSLIGVGLMGIGMMPLLLVWSRPEQPILLTLTATLLLWLGPAPGRNRPPLLLDEWARPLAILALATVALAYHFKALLLMPAYLFCLALPVREPGAARAARTPRLLAGGLLVAMTAAGTRYWIDRLACPADPLIAAAHARQSLGLGPLFQHVGIGPAVLAALGNYSLQAYFAMAAPLRWPMSRWLAPKQLSWDAQHVWIWPVTALWWMPLLLAGAAAVWALHQRRWRRISPPLAMATLLFAIASGWAASQTIRHVYEASFVLPLVMLAIVLALSPAQPPEWLVAARRRMAQGLGLAMLVSVALVLVTYAPSLARAAGQRAYLADQPWSQPVFGYASVRPRILASAQSCHIPTDGSARKLMVDDVTYLALVSSPLPQHYLGLIPPKLRGTVSDPIAYLRAAGSSGAVLACAELPPELRARARQTGEFCCLAPPDWAARGR